MTELVAVGKSSVYTRVNFFTYKSLSVPSGCISPLYATLRTMSAEFFDPKAMQLQMACSICPVRPGSGT